MKTRNHACKYKDCHKSFRSKEELEIHNKSHTYLELNLNCTECQKSFNTRQGLVEHSYTHSSKKKFRCSVIGCRKAFKQNSQLCNHRRMHRGIKEILARNDENEKNTEVYCDNLAKILIHIDFSDLNQKDKQINK